MKFSGQVKIPDLDSPGVPATILIEENQTEVFVDGESLGRWSLVDVRAERLVASAFSIDLDGEEITFLADEPTDFAYRGVDQMAKVWARYKSMSLPRRIVATSRTRNGTKPSRIDDLRLAIEETLSAEPLNALANPAGHPVVGTTTANLSGVGLPSEAVEYKPSPAAPRPVPVPEPVAVVEPEPVAVVEPEPEVVPEPVAVVEPEPVAVVEPEPVAVVESEPEPEVVAEPAAVVAKREDRTADSVFKDSVPWAKGEAAEAPANPAHSPAADQPAARGVGPIDADSSDAPWYDSEPDPALTSAAEPEQVSPEITQEIAGVSGQVDEEPLPEPVSESEDSTGEQVPWLDPSAISSTQKSNGAVEVSEPSSPTVAEPANIPAVESPQKEPQMTFMVDLGAFEDGDDPDLSLKSPSPVEPEPAMAGAAEKGRIMGAVRSAFVRSREEHSHEYVRAPGGMGIVRNICAECGHISIGIDE